MKSCIEKKKPGGLIVFRQGREEVSAKKHCKKGKNCQNLTFFCKKVAVRGMDDKNIFLNQILHKILRFPEKAQPENAFQCGVTIFSFFSTFFFKTQK